MRARSAVGLIARILVGAAVLGTKKSTKQTGVSATASTESDEIPMSNSRLLGEIENMVGDGNLLDQGYVDVTTFEPRSLTLKYMKKSPTPRMTRDEAEVITLGLVKFSIDVLIKHGYNPRERSMIIIAHAYQPAGKSVTGADQVRTFGKAMYSYVADRVTFEPETR